MMVAQTFLRNAKTTKMTSMIEITRAISTSWTEARMVVVRSTATVRCNDGEIEARRKGSRAIRRSTVSIMLAPGWRKMAMSTPGFPFERPRLRESSTESTTREYIAQPDGSALMSGDNE